MAKLSWFFAGLLVFASVLMFACTDTSTTPTPQASNEEPYVAAPDPESCPPSDGVWGETWWVWLGKGQEKVPYSGVRVYWYKPWLPPTISIIITESDEDAYFDVQKPAGTYSGIQLEGWYPADEEEDPDLYYLSPVFSYPGSGLVHHDTEMEEY